MSKFDRRNQARQKANHKNQERSRELNIFSGPSGAPRNVAVIALTEDGNPELAIRQLNESVDVADAMSRAVEGRVRVDRFKQTLSYVPVKRDLLAALDACRLADFVLLLLSSEEEVDAHGEHIIKCIESQGISTVFVAVQGLDKLAVKKRTQVNGSLKSFIAHFFPTIEKVYGLDNRQECSNVIRSLCSTAPKGIRWRDERSWMMIEDTQWPIAETNDAEAKGEVVVTGVVRGKGLKADRLVHIPGLGDYQISAITAAPLAVQKRKKDDEMTMDDQSSPEVLETPTEDQDDLATIAPEEVMMDDEDMAMDPSEKKGVLLDDHHYFSDDDAEAAAAVPKKLPKGTSSYQSAWYLEDVSDSDSDVDDEDVKDNEGDMMMDAAPAPEDGIPFNHDAMTEAGGTEYPQSEMFVDPSPEDEAEAIEAYRASRKNEAEEDLEFPDEIELHPNVLARERLQRYRGLKSLRTSTWQTDEDKPYEPENWRHLLQIADYKGSKNAAFREALIDGVKPGTRVNVHLRDVPLSKQASIKASSRALALFSLLRHEHKHTVSNFEMTLNSDEPAPLRSKEEIVVQIGPRRLVINPVYSATGNTPNNVHKFARFLHPGQTAMATFIGPLTWGSVPILVFKKEASAEDDIEIDDAAPELVESDKVDFSSYHLIGTGTTAAPSPSRIIAKRIILTGHPYKIHKKLVTVRYMFFNAEDVNWFKALQLWTKRGRSGFFRESLGTHGYFKATFDGKINPQDSVGVSLFKRVFPRPSREIEV